MKAYKQSIFSAKHVFAGRIPPGLIPAAAVLSRANPNPVIRKALCRREAPTLTPWEGVGVTILLDS